MSSPENHPRRRAGDNVPLPNPVVAAIRRNPVLVGMTLALILATIALVLVLSAQSGLRDTQQRLAGQQSALSNFIADSQNTRRTNLLSTCKQINTNSTGLNAVIAYVVRVGGQGTAFNKGLQQLEVSTLDCAALAAKVTNPPKPKKK